LSPFFIHCDWGTTSFRACAVERSRVEAVATHRSDQGAARLAADGGAERAERFRAVLAEAVLDLAAQMGTALGDATVMISGMASSSIGWAELPYAELPLDLDGRGLVMREIKPLDVGGQVHRVWLVSGARTATDVMRGEETQLIGAFQLPELAAARRDSPVILPGTHSKHVRVEAGRIQSFETFMTGEVFDVLARYSILRHSFGADGELPVELAGDRLAAFELGVDRAIDRGVLSALFQVRTRQLRGTGDAPEHRAFLSGVLIGSELAYLQPDAHEKPRGRPAVLVLCAPAALRAYYGAALTRLGSSDRLIVVSASDVDRLSALGQAVLIERAAGN
jgi:2-dehydro-3-deoxygalactonokinase